MSRLPKGFIASTSQEGQEAVERNTLCVTLLSREWRSSSDRDLSTVNRELAIQLAKHPSVQVSVFLPRCSEDDKRIAASHKVQLIEAEEMTGVDPVDWLINIPEYHVMDCIIGHGVHLGQQIPVIKRSHQCKWIQIVHNDREALAMYKSNADAIPRAEKMQQTEIELCELADQVVAIGPKVADTCRRFLRSSEKHQDVIDLTLSIFTEFLDVKQAVEERQTFCVLVIGSGDSEDFNLKGYDLAAQAIAELKEKSYQLKFVCAPRGKGDEIAEKLLRHDIDRSQLIVRSFSESRETLARLFCEVDLAIMPSRSEGFGLTALEALSAGLPVLVSSNSGLGEALMKVPYGSNCVVDSEDPKHWASKIKAVREKDRDVRLTESKLLREKYLEKYSWEKPCGVLVEKMQNLVTGSFGHSEPPSFLKNTQSHFLAGPQTPAQTYQTSHPHSPQTPAQTYQTIHPQSSLRHVRLPPLLEYKTGPQTLVQTYPETSHPQSSLSHGRLPPLSEHKTGPRTPVPTYQTSHPQSSFGHGRSPLSLENNETHFFAGPQTPAQTYLTSHPQSSLRHGGLPPLQKYKTGPRTPFQTYLETSHPQSSSCWLPSSMEYNPCPSTVAAQNCGVPDCQRIYPQSSSVQGRPPLSMEHNQLSFSACSQTPVQTFQSQSHHPPSNHRRGIEMPFSDLPGALNTMSQSKVQRKMLPMLQFERPRYKPYKLKGERQCPKEERVYTETCDAKGPNKIAECGQLRVDKIDVEPLKPWETGSPRCPLHPQYRMCIKKIKTKNGPAQLHHCPHKECVIACLGDNERRNEFIYQVDRSLHQCYRDPHCPLVCYCGDLLCLKLSRSEKNPNRLFLTCKKGECKMFQWGDEWPSQWIKDHWCKYANN